MWPYFLLLFISTALSANIVKTSDEPESSATSCPYEFDGQSYTRTSILMIKGLPTNLVYNPQNGDLLFTLIDLDSLQNDDEQTKMDQYILRNGAPVKIDNVNGQAAAVDVSTGRVYIASDDGLNVLNSTLKANFVSLKDEDIVQLFKPANKDDIYTVVFPENEVFVLNLQKNEKKKVDHVPCAFILAVDSNDNIYYECDSKYVKVLLKDFTEPVEFAGLGKNTGRAIAVNYEDKVILAANDGLYHLRPDNIIPKKLMNLDFVPSGIAFSDDKFFLSTSGIIYEYSAKEC